VRGPARAPANAKADASADARAEAALSGARQARSSFLRRLASRAEARDFRAFVVPAPEVARARGVDLRVAFAVLFSLAGRVPWPSGGIPSRSCRWACFVPIEGRTAGAITREGRRLASPIHPSAWNPHSRKFGVASDRSDRLQDLERGMSAPLRSPNAATW
jgi:hypothetical protein